jgi:transposase
MCTMPKAFPKEFREDVIRVYRDSDASLAQVAKDFGISPSCLKRWVTIDDRKSTHPSPAGRAANESDTLREANKRTSEQANKRTSEQADQAARARERGPAPGRGLSLSRQSAAKMMYPFVRELAEDGIPVAVTCRVSRSPASPTTAGSRIRSPKPS